MNEPNLEGIPAVTIGGRRYVIVSEEDWLGTLATLELQAEPGMVESILRSAQQGVELQTTARCMARLLECLTTAEKDAGRINYPRQNKGQFVTLLRIGMDNLLTYLDAGDAVANELRIAFRNYAREG